MDEEILAAAIHETWRAMARSQGWSMAPALDRPWADLPEAAKADNRAAARRIPEVLAVAGLGLAGADDASAPAIPPEAWDQALVQTMEAMAEAEHDGWMAHRARTGWRRGETRDDDAKLHPSMIPYADLSETEKDKDRSNIRHYPQFVARAGGRIVRVDPV
jgi:hypothetical protein